MKRINLNIQCKVCNNEEFSIWGESDNSILYQCSNCGLVFFFPYPSSEELNEYYNSKYHLERGYGGDNEAGRLRKKMYELDIKDLEKTIVPEGRFLDVGCAEGVFLSMLNKKWEKYGIDVSKIAIEKASKKEGISAYTKNISDLNDHFFNVIHLRGVFEHLLDPLDFVKIANRKLKNNGFLVLSNTPNIGGIVPRIFKGRFKLVIPNEHLHYFTIMTIQKIFDLSGFKMISYRYPYFGTPYCSFLKNIFEMPINYLTGKKSPAFCGNIFTIYAKKYKTI